MCVCGICGVICVYAHMCAHVVCICGMVVCVHTNVDTICMHMSITCGYSVVVHMWVYSIWPLVCLDVCVGVHKCVMYQPALNFDIHKGIFHFCFQSFVMLLPKLCDSQLDPEAVRQL